MLCLGCDIESVKLCTDLDAWQTKLIFEHGLRTDKMKDSSTSFTIDRYLGREEEAKLILAVLQHVQDSTSWQSNQRGFSYKLTWTPLLFSSENTHTRQTQQRLWLLRGNQFSRGEQTGTFFSHSEVIDGFSLSLPPFVKKQTRTQEMHIGKWCLFMFLFVFKNKTMDQIGQCLSNKTSTSQLKWASFFASFPWLVGETKE